MIISCIGDSLTEGDYGVFGKSGIANVKSLNYPYFLQKIMGGEVRNFGKCGYRPSNSLEMYRNGQINVRNSDIILILLGTNGGVHPTDNTAAENVAYQELLELCKKDAPKAKIILCTPPHVTENPEYSNCGYAAQVADAVTFIRVFAKENGYSLLDTASCPEFTAETETIMQPNDGLHFGEEGYRVLAKYIAEQLTLLV